MIVGTLFDKGLSQLLTGLIEDGQGTWDAFHFLFLRIPGVRAVRLLHDIAVEYHHLQLLFAQPPLVEGRAQRKEMPAQQEHDEHKPRDVPGVALGLGGRDSASSFRFFSPWRRPLPGR